MAVKAVFFDVGETLVDETRAFEEVADAAGVPRLTFFSVLGGVLARGADHGQVFELLGVDRPEWPGYGRADLYPDAIPCLAELRRRGYRVGVAGNQPHSCEQFLRDAGVDVDCIGSSAGWGVRKPSQEFFTRVAAEADAEPGEIAYVGDRVDFDVIPARAAGMVAVHIRRGPWGYLQDGREQADVCIDSLSDLPDALARV
ncbi:MAG: HAD family hydrolase [Actinobacteria bacterium]|nr:HAD family hydrolase [Actinomycetota bacterium]